MVPATSKKAEPSASLSDTCSIQSLPAVVPPSTGDGDEPSHEIPSFEDLEPLKKRGKVSKLM